MKSLPPPSEKSRSKTKPAIAPGSLSQPPRTGFDITIVEAPKPIATSPGAAVIVARDSPGVVSSTRTLP